MSERPAAPAARIQPPSWRDSRFAIGLIIFLGAVALGSYFVARADERVPMYAASGVLAPGQTLTEASVVRVDVRLGDGMARYLSAQAPLPADRVLLREVRAGELVPLSAIGDLVDAALSPVTIAVDPTIAGPLMTGTVVDVFVNHRVLDGARDEYSGPELLLEGVTVAGVDTGTGGGLGSSGLGTAVRIMVPSDQVPDLIAAVDLEAKVTVVPVPGAVIRAGG